MCPSQISVVNVVKILEKISDLLSLTARTIPINSGATSYVEALVLRSLSI
jgi:hypothetical protein